MDDVILIDGEIVWRNEAQFSTRTGHYIQWGLYMRGRKIRSEITFHPDPPDVPPAHPVMQEAA